MPEQRIKKYVEVIADFLPDGTLTPQTVIWDTASEILEDRRRRRSVYLPDRPVQHLLIL